MTVRSGGSRRRQSGPTRRQLRAQVSELERRIADLTALALAAERYVDEIYAPNLKEPFSIANRRADLVDVVRAMQARRSSAARRAA